MKQRVISLVFAGAAIAVPAMAQAHFLWATIDAKTKAVTVEFNETPGPGSLALDSEKRGRLKAFGKPNQALALKAEGNLLVSAPGPKSAVVELNYGVLDKREQDRGLFWLWYFAKAAETPEASQAVWNQPLELTLTVGADGTATVTVLQNSKPAAGAELVATLPNTKEPFKGKSDAEGHVILPGLAKGPLSVRAMLVENTKGAALGASYDFIRRYASLNVSDISGRAQQLASVKKVDPAAYAVLEKASKARQTMPDDVKSITGSVSVVTEGKSVSATFTYSKERKMEVVAAGLTEGALTDLRAEISTIFGHRTSGDFAKGNGKYPIQFADQVTGATRRIALNDESNSFFRVRGDEIVEVDREMHGNRFIITMLETTRTPEGKSLPKVFTVSYFNPQTKALIKAMYYTDEYVQTNGVWIPQHRSVTTAENGATKTVEIHFSNLKVER
jgi:hypothetical protein